MGWDIPDAPYIREAEACGFDGWPRTRSKWDEWDRWWRGDDEEDDEDAD